MQKRSEKEWCMMGRRALTVHQWQQHISIDTEKSLGRANLIFAKRGRPERYERGKIMEKRGVGKKWEVRGQGRYEMKKLWQRSYLLEDGDGSQGWAA